MGTTEGWVSSEQLVVKKGQIGKDLTFQAEKFQLGTLDIESDWEVQTQLWEAQKEAPFLLENQGRLLGGGGFMMDRRT